MMGEVSSASCRLSRAGGDLQEMHRSAGLRPGSWVHQPQHPKGLLPPSARTAPRSPGTPSPASLGAPSSAGLELPPPLRSALPNCFSLSACMNVNKTGIDCSTR